jgi:hypothetical protein
VPVPRSNCRLQLNSGKELNVGASVFLHRGADYGAKPVTIQNKTMTTPSAI